VGEIVWGKLWEEIILMDWKETTSSHFSLVQPSSSKSREAIRVNKFTFFCLFFTF